MSSARHDVSVSAAVFLTLGSLCAVACKSTPPPWEKPTIYIIRDLNQDGIDSLKKEFSDPLSECGFTQNLDQSTREFVAAYLGEHAVHAATASAGVASEAGARPQPELFVFELHGLKDMNQLRDVQARIQEISVEQRVPVKLQRALMDFASVTGGAGSHITLTGEATEGATVWLDVGQPELVRAELTRGTWSFSITDSEKLVGRGGWVYGCIQKGDAQQFIKINVLRPKSFERILPEDLPADSKLKRTP